MYILKNAQLIFTYRMTARMSDYLYTHPYFSIQHKTVLPHLFSTEETTTVVRLVRDWVFVDPQRRHEQRA